MSSSGSDDATRRAPMQLPQFGKVMRGYDPQEVEPFLRTALVRVRDLEGRVVELEGELEAARTRSATMTRGPEGSGVQDPYEAFSGHVAEVVRAFDQDVERVRAEAETEAKAIVEGAKERAKADNRDVADRTREARIELERLLADARAEADRIRLDAQSTAEVIKAEADRTLEDARSREKEFLSDLETRRGSLMTEMRSLRDGMLEAAGKLDTVLGKAPAIVDVSDAEESPGQVKDERSELSRRSW